MTSDFPTRRLGRNGPQIPALGFGLMGLSSFYGPAPPNEERFKVLDRAYELGCTHWDTAAFYGDSEEMAGEWFQKTGKRDEIFLATKFGAYVLPDGSFSIRNEPDFIRKAILGNFERLKTDRIDLLYCHRLSGDVPIEDIVAVMKEFVDAGKVRYLGLSECSADTLRRASKIHPISAYQIEYSPFSLDIERPEIGALDTCRELGIAVVAYSPLGRGLLTGQYKSPDDFAADDIRRILPRFSKERFPKNIELVDTLKAIAARKGYTSGQLSLAWLMHQGDDIIPIPGTKKLKYLEENAGSRSLSLTADEVSEVRRAIEKAEISGERYPEALMKDAFKDTVLPK